MNNSKLSVSRTALAASLIGGMMSVTPVFAQEEENEATSTQDTILVTGTRRAARTSQESIAPIDVVSPQDLQRQGDNDVLNLIRTTVPSFNVNAQGTQDAASIVRPVNLRGLSPDQTLVLINGKRLQRAGVISFLGGGISNGAQGPDVSSIPSLALKQVEVLRDGAASQYGSDAIAGVINFILKDDREGGTVSARWGSTYDGDGDNYQIAGNIGLPLGPEGFLNLTAEFQERDATSRSVQRGDCAALIAAGNTAVADPCQIHGDPEVRNDFKLFANLGVPVSEHIEVYALGNYGGRETEGPFFFRNPASRGGVFTGGPLVDPLTGFADPNGVNAVLVGDLSVDTAGDCPAGIPLTAGGGLLPDPTILAQVQADPNCFSFVELFPGGYTPNFGGNVDDFSVHGGFRGTAPFGTGLNYDISYRHGENNVDFFLGDSTNPSLGPNTPTEFFAGGYGSTVDVFNADFSYALPVGFASDLNIGFGVEWRDESFTIVAGDPESFEIGPLAAPSSAFPLGQGFNSSSDGFPGFSTAAAGTNSQSSTGYYLDLEADVIDQLTLQAAVRYEDTEFFGDTTNFKVGGLFRLTDWARLRATYSTGFRVPTAGQVNVINATTGFGPGGELADQGTFPLFSPAGQILANFISGDPSLGGLGLDTPTLLPEESDNISVGFGFDIGDINLTVDYFNIQLEDRISQSAQLAFVPALEFLAAQNSITLAGTTPGAIINELDGAGVLNATDFVGAANLSSFAFFSNDFDTTTQGVDVVATGPLNFGQSGDTDFVLAFNYTTTNVTDTGQTVSAVRLQQLEDGLPEVRAVLTVNHHQGPFRFLARGNYFGPFTEAHFDSLGLSFDASAQFTFDAEIGYRVAENVEIVAGAANLFDSFPEENPFANILGAQFAVTGPGGFNGGAYYFRTVIDF